MFKISRRLDYGLQLLSTLASNPDNQPQSTAFLAEKLNIPLPFLHQIGHTLMQAGLIKASPGPRGGIRLNRAPESVTLLQIVEVLEGTVSVPPCPDCKETCERYATCTTLSVWAGLQEKVLEYLSGIRLSDLVGIPQPLQSIPAQTFSSVKSEYNI